MATPGSLQYISGSGQSIAIGNRFAQQIVVRVLDTTGAPMPGEPVIWGTAVANASGTFQSTGTRNFTGNADASGYAYSDFIYANATVGTWLGLAQFLNAQAIPGASFSLTNVASGPASVSIYQGRNQTVAFNTALTRIGATVYDAAATPLAFITVRFSVPPGHGTFAGGVTTVDVSTSPGSGQALAPVFTSNNVAGSFTVTVTVPSTPSVPADTGTWTVADANAAATVQLISGNTQQTPTLSPFTQPLKVRVLNGLGNPMAGVSVTFTSPVSGQGCTFATRSTSTAVSDASGYAQITAIANGTVGQYFVQATVAGATGAQFTLTNGVSYLPEVCTASAAPVGATQGTTGAASWINLNNSFNGNTTGANVTVGDSGTAKVLSIAPAAAAALDPIMDEAKITKFVFTCDFRGTIAVGGSYSPTAKTRLVDGTGSRSGTVNQSTGSTFAAFTRTISAFTSPNAITGAQLKAGSFGLGIDIANQAGMAGTLYVRNVKMSICYQNPSVPATSSISVPLQFCEV